MTPQQIDQAIAEACGWVEVHSTIGNPSTLYGWHPEKHPKEKYSNETLIPRYATDLNAMHEAEKTLDRGENHLMRGGFGLYLINLPRVCDGEPRVCATAAQRAEAFLRTIGQDERTLQLKDKEGEE